jgi:hypothetical protein
LQAAVGKSAVQARAMSSLSSSSPRATRTSWTHVSVSEKKKFPVLAAPRLHRPPRPQSSSRSQELPCSSPPGLMHRPPWQLNE